MLRNRSLVVSGKRCTAFNRIKHTPHTRSTHTTHYSHHTPHSSDTVCPFCYLAYKRLERAIAVHLAQHPTSVFRIFWEPFELNPTLGEREQRNQQDYYAERFGDDTERVLASLRAAGEAEVSTTLGLFHVRFLRILFLAIARSQGVQMQFTGSLSSSLRSHRLVMWAAMASSENRDVASALQTRLFLVLFRY